MQSVFERLHAFDYEAVIRQRIMCAYETPHSNIEQQQPCCCSLCDCVSMRYCTAGCQLLMSLFTVILFSAVVVCLFFGFVTLQNIREFTHTHTHHIAPSIHFVVIFKKCVLCRYFDCVFMLFCANKLINWNGSSSSLSISFSLSPSCASFTHCFFHIRYAIEILIKFKTLNRIGDAFA